MYIGFREMWQVDLWTFLIPNMRKGEIMCITEDNAHSQMKNVKYKLSKLFPTFLFTII